MWKEWRMRWKAERVDTGGKKTLRIMRTVCRQDCGSTRECAVRAPQTKQKVRLSKTEKGDRMILDYQEREAIR